MNQIYTGRFYLSATLYMGLNVQIFMFSSNKKYKWLTFILKYGEDDNVKY
jgi:hypothetical protein